MAKTSEQIRGPILQDQLPEAPIYWDKANNSLDI